MRPGSILVKTAAGSMDVYVAGPKGGSKSCVILFMDGLGTRSTLERVADRLATEGFLTLLPNLYYRHGAIAPINITLAFQPGSEQDRMMYYYRSLNASMVADDIASLLNDEAVDLRRMNSIGCLGYCMGGAFAVYVAGRFPDRVKAVACIHGGGLVTNAIDSPHRGLADTKARFYLALAEDDPYFPSEAQAAFFGASADAGVDYVCEIYKGTCHGFAVSDTPAFDPVAEARNWTRVQALFSEVLR